MAGKQTKAKAQEKTPILRAQHIYPDMRKMAGKVLSYIAIYAFLSLVLSAVTGGGTIWGMALNIVLLVCFFLLELMEGGTRGERDVTMSRTVEGRLREKNVQPEKDELARCYGPRKAFIAFGLAVSGFFLCAVVVALAAKPYTYTLQDLPSWLSAYTGRDDVGGALEYYTVTGGASVVDYLRILVRACILPFVNLFPDVQAASYLIDRLSPLFILILPISYPLGYLMGPMLYDKRIRENEAAKKANLKRIRRKNKKERQQRQGGVIREKNLQEKRDKLEQKREQQRKDKQLI